MRAKSLLRGFLFLFLLLFVLYILALVGEHWGIGERVLPSMDYFRIWKQERDTLQEQREDSMKRQLVEVDSVLACMENTVPAPLEEDSVVLPVIPSPLAAHPLEHNEEGRRQLERFFESLRALKLKGEGSVRIFHYGDSQIEGDRITSYIRSRLMHGFGGGGVGLLALGAPTYPPYGLTLEISPNIAFYSMMPVPQRKKGAPYGVMGMYNGVEEPFLSPEEEDSVSSSCWLSFQVKRKRSVGSSMHFTRLVLLLHQSESAVCGKLFLHEQGDTVISVDSVPVKHAGVMTLTLPVPDSVNHFTVRVYGMQAPVLQAISLEKPGGVQVDNMPLRGSSGTDFTAIADSVLMGSNQVYSPRLLLLQFGANVVPGKLDNYDYYETQLRRHIRRLQRFFPDAGIILLGATDMAEKKGLEYRTYENHVLVRQAQRKAALACGITYWDSFTAMGGENSIVSWVMAEPPLANTDYVHFTPRGARLFGELFYAALMAEYKQYVETHEYAEEREQ